MKKEKGYAGIKFGPEAISQAFDIFISLLSDREKERQLSGQFFVNFGGESWTYDSVEEFYSDCRKNCSEYLLTRYAINHSLWVSYSSFEAQTTVNVEGNERAEIEKVFEAFEANADSCRLPEPEKKNPSPPRARVFIGHGNSEQWRDVKDHLHEKHGYDVEAYEIGARGGHTIRDILEDMLSKSSFAILVMTGEDKDENGNLRARQNVIHELGLFQGRIGFARAIVLLEADTEEFSNIHGIHQIRYGKGNIKETFGDVLATLKREFG